MEDDLSVALIVGGHSFDPLSMLTMFNKLPGIETYPQDLMTFVERSDLRDEYDAAVFYNFHDNQGVPGLVLPPHLYDQVENAIRDLGEAGTGIVPLHHGVAAFVHSEEWRSVTGLDGGSLTGAHVGETFQVDVADPAHPVTEDLSSFEMTDETYTMDEPDGDSQVLLTTGHEPGMDALAWTRQYENARVFCYQSGHDNEAFGDPNFRQVLSHGIWWAAGVDELDVTIQ
ncbi:ThuA domain-containing protein [Halosimplex amylolyticum]|uniref:ThuA domain-containing protein n=1 Tax=Halosimplex amylolyticum TaxID=3396616 RepID=UPI003F5432C0